MDISIDRRHNNNQLLEIFYNSECPICCRMATWVEKRDRKNLLRLTKLKDVESILHVYGIDAEKAYEVVHGVYYGQCIMRGFPLIEETFYLLGYKKIWRFMGWGPGRWLSRKIYDLVNLYRRWSS